MGLTPQPLRWCPLGAIDLVSPASAEDHAASLWILAIAGDGLVFAPADSIGGPVMGTKLEGKRIAIVATDGFEQVELTEPMKALTDGR